VEQQRPLNLKRCLLDVASASVCNGSLRIGTTARESLSSQFVISRLICCLRRNRPGWKEQHASYPFRIHDKVV
jgi:hypothetical protein